MADTLPATCTATVTRDAVSPASFSILRTATSPVTWAVVPARKGSKGCPNKALRPFQGCSLLELAVRDAADLCPGRVILTTDYSLSELPDRLWWAWHRRPDDLCHDDTPMSDVLLWVAHQRKMRPEDWILLLQPSSFHPERVALARLLTEQDAGMTGMAYPDRWHPYYAVDVTHGLPQRRQGLPTVYRPDGLVYRVRVDALSEVEPFTGPLMPVDGTVMVDTEADWRELVRRHGRPQDRDVQ